MRLLTAFEAKPCASTPRMGVKPRLLVEWGECFGEGERLMRAVWDPSTGVEADEGGA